MKNKQEMTKEKRWGGGGVLSKTCVGTLCLALATPFLFAGCSDSADIKGTKWYQGVETPAVTQGVNGDFYIDTDDYLLYQKVDGTWTIVMRDFGKKGADGSTGQTGQTGQAGVAGNGIASILKTKTEGNVDTYTITFTDASVAPVTFTVTNGTVGAKGNGIVNVSINSAKSDAAKTTYVVTFDEGEPFEFEVKNGTNGQNGADGVGIASVAKTSTTGLVDLYTITYTNNTTSTFTVVNGKDGVGIEDVDISFVYDNDGNEFVKIIIKYDDASKADKTLSIPVPARVENVVIENPSYAKQASGIPQITLIICYENGKTERVTATKSMIDNVDDIDFSQVGTHSIGIRYQGKIYLQEITIYDPADIAVESVRPVQYSMVMLVGDDGRLIEDYSTFSVIVEYEDGNQINKKLTDAEFTVNSSAFSAAGTPFDLQIRGFEQDFTIKAYPITADTLASMTPQNAFYSGEFSFIIEKSADLNNYFDENDIIESWYDFDEINNNVYYVRKITTDDFDETIDTNVEGNYSLNFKNTDYGMISVKVYDPATIRLNGAHISDIIIVGESVENVNVSLEYAMANHDSFSRTVNLMDLTIVSGTTLDWTGILSNMGMYELVVEYNGEQVEFNIDVTDPNICNISYIYINGGSSFDYTIGTDIEEWLNANVVEQELNVNFYTPIDGEYSKTVTITRDMIDISDTDFDTIGGTTFTISYKLDGQAVGKSTECYVNVSKDMASATLLNTYTVGENFNVMGDFDQIKTYDNGIAEFISIDDDGSISSTEQYEYEMEGENLLKYKMVELNSFVYLEIKGAETSALTIDTYVPSDTFAKTYALNYEYEGDTMPLILKTVESAGETFTIVGMYVPMDSTDTTESTDAAETPIVFMHMVTVKCEYVDDTHITFGGVTYEITADGSGAVDGILVATPLA